LELTISPQFLVPRPTHAALLIEDLMNLTEPSAKAVFTPPGCREEVATTLAAPDQGRPPTSLYQHDLRLGVCVWLYENLSLSHQLPFYV
jgi:hypothetical protein